MKLEAYELRKPFNPKRVEYLTFNPFRVDFHLVSVPSGNAAGGQ